MIALASLALPIAIGWTWCRAIRVVPGRGPMALALRAGLAVALGFAVSSTLYFLLSLAGIAFLPVIAGSEIAILLGGIFLVLRPTILPTPDTVSEQPTPWRWTSLHYGLAAALVALACLAGAVAAGAYASAPHGRWDAWAIWNLRAKYLAGEGTWRNSVSPLLAETHPDYPLGTPSLIARTWAYEGSISGGRDFDPAVPAIIAALYALATLLTVVGALGTIRGPTIGLLAGCILLSAQSWVAEVGSQYADVPQGLYFAAVFSLLAIALAGGSEGTSNFRVAAMAGLFAGFGAFVKNEGSAFAVVVLVALAMTSDGRRQWRAFAIGLAPVLLLVLLFKFFIAPSDPSLSQSLGAMASKAAEAARWRAILSVFAARVWTLGEWYAHPLVLAAATWFVFLPRRKTPASDAPSSFVGQAVPLWIASALMLAAYVAAYLITPADVKWQLDTSTDRLLVQILPAALVAILVATAPEVIEKREAALPQTPGGRKGRKKQAQRITA